MRLAVAASRTSNPRLIIANMSRRSTFLLRIDPRVLDALRKWSDDEMRSTNGQIEFILREALRKAGRLPSASPSTEKRAAPDGVQGGDRSTDGPPA